MVVVLKRTLSYRRRTRSCLPSRAFCRSIAASLPGVPPNMVDPSVLRSRARHSLLALLAEVVEAAAAAASSSSNLREATELLPEGA